MAANFRILCHQNKKNLHLKLTGDFDGSSAHELINMLDQRSGNVVRIFIHTGNLKSVHPFGRAVFQNMLSLPFTKSQLIFTGENGGEIAP